MNLPKSTKKLPIIKDNNNSYFLKFDAPDDGATNINVAKKF